MTRTSAETKAVVKAGHWHCARRLDFAVWAIIAHSVAATVKPASSSNGTPHRTVPLRLASEFGAGEDRKTDLGGFARTRGAGPPTLAVPPHALGPLR